MGPKNTSMRSRFYNRSHVAHDLKNTWETGCALMDFLDRLILEAHKAGKFPAVGSISDLVFLVEILGGDPR